MADPLSLALSVAERLLVQVKNVKTNHSVCKLLEHLVENTFKLLRQLDGTLFDSPTTTALELLGDALQEAQEAVDKCCTTTLFTSLLYNDSYALALKQAAEKLEHALSQIPLASLGMTADIQSDIVALSTQIRNSKFEERAATTHQTIALKDAFEKAFNQSGQHTEEVKNLIQEVLQQQCSSRGELITELAVLKDRAYEATKRKEKQLEFELNEIIAVLSASLGEANEVPRVIDDLADCHRCPISGEIMKDPVVLKDSCMIYDRSSIEEWLRRGHCYDPLTKVELVARELVPNHALRDACQILLEQYGGESSTTPRPQEEERVFGKHVQPGLFEGHGKLAIGSSVVHVLQLLIVEPNGKVLSYALYKRENVIVEENVLEIGGGDWNQITSELSFGDNQYSYSGIISLAVDNRPFELDWNGKVSKANAQNEGHSLALTYSPPSINRSTMLHPTILQMEGAIETVRSKAKYKSQMVLSLEVDSTIGGWMWFASDDQSFRFVGRIIEGRWEYDGTLTFSVYFSHDNSPLNSSTRPTNYSAIYKISGNVGQDERYLHSNFTAVATRAKSEGGQKNNASTRVPLDDMPILEYSLIRESSTPWHHLHPNPVKLFNLSRTYELRSLDSSVKANFDLSYGSFPHYLRTWGRSPLHIASWNNSISMVKELLSNGVDANVKDNNGQSPLHHASCNNSIDAIKALIEKGANVDIRDKNGKSPLYAAFDNNFSNIVKEFLHNGADINLQDDNGWSQLHHATYDNNIDVVKGLICNGARIDIQDNCGRTPLYIAFENTSINIIKEFLDNGASIDFQDTNGWSLLHHAINNNSVDVVKALLENGANMDILDVHGKGPLYIAFDKKFIDVIKELLDSGANVDLQDKDGWTLLHHSSKNNESMVVKELIDNGASVDLQENKGRSSLHIASQNGHIEVVKELILNGANVNLQGNDGWSSLHFASQNGRVNVVQELIANGADVNLAMDDGVSSLCIASRYGRIEVVKELIANSTDVNLQSSNGVSPLLLASEGSHIEVVKELIANGADINLSMDDGVSSLCIASQNGHVDVVKDLIANGADVNLQDNDGWSSLHFASQNGHIDIVKELIFYGADGNLQESSGASSLHIASQHGHVDVVKDLIANHANVNLQKNNGGSSLHMASQDGHIDVVKELIVKGVNVNLQVNNGVSSLYIASQNGYINVVKELIVNGANLNLQENYGQSPLCVAAREGHTDVVKELLANGADVNLQDINGASSLHTASQEGHIDIVKEIIANDANVDLKTTKGNTPLHVAASSGRVHIVQALLEHGASKKSMNNWLQQPRDVVCTNRLYGPYEETIINELKFLLRGRPSLERKGLSWFGEMSSSNVER